MLKKAVLVVQAKDTGRFLLKKREGTWGFAAEVPFDPEVATLFLLLREANKNMGLPDDSDEFCLDFIDNIAKIQIFHASVETESLGDVEAEWCHLFTFPEAFDPDMNKVFHDKRFLEKVLTPEI